MLSAAGIVNLLATGDAVRAAAVPAGVAVMLAVAAAAGAWGTMIFRRLRARTARERDRTARLRRRTRVLERILAVSARINATRQLPELTDRVVAAAADLLGYERVVLYLWSDAGRAFQVRAARGVTPDVLAGSRPVTREQYAGFTDPDRRRGACYLLPAATAEADDGGGVRAQSWRLVAPLEGAAGEVLGYLELHRPAAGGAPGRAEIRHLEFLARQSATAVESAAVYDRLSRNNAELSLASEKLASLADMKANFVANVSHELRTPLTSISAYTELLQQNLASMSRESLDEFLKVIHAESTKLTAVINDILELGQMENGRPAPTRNETDLVALVRRLEEGWRGRAAESGLELQVDAPPAPLPLPVDPVLLQQLLTHLLANACKFTPPGGRVSVSLRESGTAVRLTVQDTGIGIPADKLGAIFDKFYQVDGSATRRHNGQGVGLAICHEIVGHHDGRIWAENVAGGGARFTVLLPRRAAVVQPVRARDHAGQPFEAGEFLQRLLYWLAESLGVHTVTLMEPEPDGLHLGIRAAIGVNETVVQGVRVRRGAGIAGRVWATGESVRIDDLTRDPRFGREENEPRYTTPSVLCVPLPGPAGPSGVIAVNNRADGRPLDDDDRLFLEALAPRVVELLRRHEDWLQATRELGALRDSLRATTAVGRLRQESLLELCQEICLAAARRAGLTARDLHHLAFALQFYDVGMGCVPPELLNKPEPLAAPEQRVMQQHVEAGLDILDVLRPDPEARQIILHHHENFDGSGYPGGVAGEGIPTGARLLRLADTLAALLSPRPWRAALTLDDALAEIAAGVGRQFCPGLGPTFLAEAAARRERIAAMQRRGADGRDLARPVLDRRGMVPIG
ncbi:MAG: HD domain-containing phosphohydrolase [Candidatus Krumholzibacteriia bacterium]